MAQFHDVTFPGESAEYRDARDKLLGAELDLRRQTEWVAAMRRDLPRGGALAEDYVFEEGAAELSDQDTVGETRFSELFAEGKDSLVLYGLMFAPGDEKACPMCTAFLDSLNGAAPHIGQRVNLAVVAKAPIGKVRAWALGRGWINLRLLSSGNNSFNADYHTETADGEQIGMINVFQRGADGIRHVYNSELLFSSTEQGQHPRHIDPIWPLWNVFDLTPAGRGTDWFPQLSYD